MDKHLFKLKLIFILIFTVKSESLNSVLDINLKKPIVKELNNDQYWLNKLIIILIDYSTLLVPLISLVYLVKRNLCLNLIQKSKFVQIFVFGKKNNSINLDVEEELLKSSKKNTKKLNTNDLSFNSLLTFIYCFFGLLISYLIWGIFQEKIMTTHYQKNNSSNYEINEFFRFKDSQFLVLVNRTSAFIFSSIILIILNLKKNWSIKSYNSSNLNKKYKIAPINEFVYCSLSNVLSSWCQYEALKYVNFPILVLSKACKLIAVMIMSQLINQKKYKKLDYLLALSITLGMSLFLFGNQKEQENYLKKLNETNYEHTLIDGLFILILYITFDSFTSNWQSKLFENYETSSIEMLSIVNFYSIIFIFVSLTETGNLINNFKLVLSSNELTRDCFLLSLCSAIGQLFVFYTISKFGALLFTTIMTLRQALAILLSCIIYKHNLSFLSFIGILFIFTALFYQIYFKLKVKKFVT